MMIRTAVPALATLLVASPLFAQAPRPPATPAPAGDPALAAISGPLLRVSNMERSLKFYTEGLGLVVVRQGSPMVLAGAGKGPPPIIMLQQSPASAPPFKPNSDGLIRFYMSAPDTNALFVRLKERGYAPYRSANEPSGIIFVNDPDGYIYEFTQSPGTAAPTARGR